MQQRVHDYPCGPVNRGALADAQAASRQPHLNLAAALGGSAELTDHRGGPTGTKPAVESGGFCFDQRPDTPHFGAPPVAVGRGTRLDGIQVVQTHAGQVGHCRVDVPRDGQIQQQQRPTASAADGGGCIGQAYHGARGGGGAQHHVSLGEQAGHFVESVRLARSDDQSACPRDRAVRHVHASETKAAQVAQGPPGGLAGPDHHRVPPSVRRQLLTDHRGRGRANGGRATTDARLGTGPLADAQRVAEERRQDRASRASSLRRGIRGPHLAEDHRLAQ